MAFKRPLWPRLSLVCSAVTTMLVLADLHSPLRAVLVASFVLICPGLSWVRLVRLADAIEEIVLGIAVSLAAATILALGMVYTHIWSATLGVLVLVVVTLAANYLELSGSRLPQRPHEGATTQ